MSALRLAAALVWCAGLSACSGVHCLALCVPLISVSFENAQGEAVAPARGTLALGSGTASFDCSVPEQLTGSDGGWTASVSCTSTGLQISQFNGEPTELTLSVTAAGGSAFSGPVTLVYGETRNVCGTRCRDASGKATLR